MLQELTAVSYSQKRSLGITNVRAESDFKGARITAPMKCYNCGKPGHKAIACRFGKDDGRKDLPPSDFKMVNNTQSMRQPGITGRCFKCNEVGHFASRCPTGRNEVAHNSSTIVAEKRVDLCSFSPPLGRLQHSGE